MDEENQVISVWSIPEDFDEALIGSYVRAVSPEQGAFRKAQRVETLPPRPQFAFEVPSSSLEEFDILPNTALLPLVDGEHVTS